MIREMENGLVIFQQLMAGRHKCGNRALLGVLLHYGCAIYYHWGKLSKGYMESLCIISYNCMWNLQLFQLKFSTENKKEKKENKNDIMGQVAIEDEPE